MQWKEMTLTRDEHCSFYCRTIGEGQPLLMIHGAACDSEFFIDTAPILAQKYQVILYDRSGYGRSVQDETCVAKDCTAYFNGQGDDGAWILQQLAPDRKAIVVGCSCGAAVASYLAARHPEVVERVFLHEPPFYSLLPDYKEGWDRIEGIFEAIGQGKYNRALNRFLLFLGSNSAPSKKPMTEAEMENFTANGLVFIRNEFAHGFDKDFRVPQMRGKVNISVLWGLDGEGTPLAVCAGRLAEALDCPLYAIPGGHNAAREDPEDFAQAVMQLVDKEKNV